MSFEDSAQIKVEKKRIERLVNTQSNGLNKLRDLAHMTITIGIQITQYGRKVIWPAWNVQNTLERSSIDEIHHHHQDENLVSIKIISTRNQLSMVSILVKKFDLDLNRRCNRLT